MSSDFTDVFIRKKQATSRIRSKRDLRKPNFYRECISTRSADGGCEFQEFVENCYTEGVNLSPNKNCDKYRKNWSGERNPVDGHFCRDQTRAKEGYDELILLKLQVSEITQSANSESIKHFSNYNKQLPEILARRERTNKKCSRNPTETPKPEPTKPETSGDPGGDPGGTNPDTKCVFGLVGDGCQVKTGAAISLVSLSALFVFVVIGYCIWKYCQTKRKLLEKRNENQKLRQFTIQRENSSQKPLLSPTSPNSDISQLTGRSSVKLSVSSDPGISRSLSYVSDPKLRKQLLSIIIHRSKITIGNVLKEGHFGIVHLGELKIQDGKKELVAIKSLKQAKRTEELEQFLREGNMMNKFDHPHVLRLIGVCVGEENERAIMPMLVLPYMKKGDLCTYLRTETQPIAVNRLGGFCTQIASGMEYLSQENMIHRDLAARNCMIDELDQVKVSDFGLSKDLNYYNYAYYKQKDRNQELPLKWMPPEAISYGKFSDKSDVWSWGITCWEIFTRGAIPYPTIQPVEIVEYLKLGKRLNKPDYCEMQTFKLMLSCWNWDSEKRPDFSHIFSFMENAFPIETMLKPKLSTVSQINRGIYGNPSMANRTPVAGLGSPNLGSPNLGSPNLGSPNLGNPNLGSPNPGNPNLGNPILGGQHQNSQIHPSKNQHFRQATPEMGVHRRQTLHSATSVTSRNFRQNVSNVSDAAPLMQSTSFDPSRQPRPTSSSSLNKSGTFTLTKTGHIVGNGISQRQHSINSPNGGQPQQKFVQQFNQGQHGNDQHSAQNLYNTLQ